jgi:hypothetical protein
MPLRPWKSTKRRTKVPGETCLRLLQNSRETCDYMGNVTFPDRFELIELLREDEVQTFRARDRTTGRFFEAHFAASPDLLAEVQAVIDRGSHEGKFYVISGPPAEPAPLDSAGAWRIRPAAQPASPAPQEPAADPAPAALPEAEPSSAPGDFTRMFQLRQAPEPLAAPASKPTERPAATSQPGEFTRAFPRVFERPAVAPSAAPADSPAPGQPGDFTRMFQQPAAPVPAVPDHSVPAPSVAASQPEEAGPAAPARLPAGLIVIAVVILSAIVVFVLVRRLY